VGTGRNVHLIGASPAGVETANGVHLSATEISTRRIKTMLWTIAIVLLVLWALGMVTAYTVGGFIHILLVLAVVAILIQVIQGRRVI
jgi:hypothetical protein